MGSIKSSSDFLSNASTVGSNGTNVMGISQNSNGNGIVDNIVSMDGFDGEIKTGVELGTQHRGNNLTACQPNFLKKVASHGREEEHVSMLPNSGASKCLEQGCGDFLKGNARNDKTVVGRNGIVSDHDLIENGLDSVDNNNECNMSFTPLEALNYTPAATEILKPTGGRPVRLIFGDLPLQSWELEGLNGLRETLAKQQVSTDNSVFEDDRYCVRFLQGNDWDLAKCCQDVKRHIKWRAEFLPVSRNAVLKVLPRGFIYIHGRDHGLRPLIVISCSKLLGATEDDVMPVVIYWLEFTLEKLLVKNRVEQWRVLVDLSECSVTNAPVAILKRVCDTLVRNYRGRLFHMHIINAGFVFRSLWQLVSVILPERTKTKITLTSSNFKDELLSGINQNQVECRFGGLCPDAVDFSLPICPVGPYTKK